MSKKLAIAQAILCFATVLSVTLEICLELEQITKGFITGYVVIMSIAQWLIYKAEVK